ncbi:carbon storage regulator [Halobacillus sp. A1]|uniref:carbon storage regulator n=1 Tax=Halobacillus sp. A1 TaxID=2880262 RepID=UPI0020A6A340|nr:carbon storage regulator [Halobacillus sp. A1]
MALVIGRNPGEKIIVEHKGETLVIEAIKTEDGLLRIGLEAASSFKIAREEIHGRNS